MIGSTTLGKRDRAADENLLPNGKKSLLEADFDFIRNNLKNIKQLDLQIAMDIAGFANMNTRDARGNVVPSLWSKHFDNSTVGLLIERNDVRQLLLKQIEQQLADKKDIISEVQQNEIICKWILDFTNSWENVYADAKMQECDLGQVVLSAMQEAYFEVQSFLEEHCVLRPTIMRRKIQSAVLLAEEFNKTQPENKKLKFHNWEDCLIRFLFRQQNIGLVMRRIAGKIMKKQEVCNKAGSYSAKVQRNDVTQEVNISLDLFCSNLLRDHISFKEALKDLHSERDLLVLCLDHRGFPKNITPPMANL